jgi:hypothetical protein
MILCLSRILTVQRNSGQVYCVKNNYCMLKIILEIYC